MDIDEISLACPVPELSQCLNKGHTLYIADCTTLVDGKPQTEEEKMLWQRANFLACGHIPIRLGENMSVKCFSCDVQAQDILIHTSGSSPESSAGTFATRSIQS